MSGVLETASTVSAPPAQVTAAPSVYIRPYATAEYKHVYSSPPPPPTESIPHGAIVIKHVNLHSDQRRKWGRGRPRKIERDGSGVSSQQPIGGAMPQDFSPPPPPPPQQTEARPPVGELAPDVAENFSNSSEKGPMSSVSDSEAVSPSSVQRNVAPDSVPPPQARAQRQMYMRPYVAFGYKPVYSSPPYLFSIPPVAVIIKHVDSNQRRKRFQTRKIGPNSSVVSFQRPINDAMPHNFSLPPQQTVTVGWRIGSISH